MPCEAGEHSPSCGASVFDFYKLNLHTMVKVATNSNFSEIISSGHPVLVDFWATWCGPCRALSPTVDEVASEYEGRVDVVKCNVDDCDEVAGEYRVMSIPTLLYFKDGKLVDKSVGLVPKDDIVSRLSKIL